MEMTSVRDNHSFGPSKIAIVGGGIIGICTSLALQDQYPHSSITLYSDRWTPQTTGNVSAGLIFPYSIGPKTDPNLLDRLLGDTMLFFQKLISDPLSGEIGVSLLTTYELNESTHTTIPSFPNVLDIRNLTENELNRIRGNNERLRSGLKCTTYIAEPTLLLPYLMERFKCKGGIMVTQKISALNQLTVINDLVVNCTGIGSRYLHDVQDQRIHSLRGQVARIRAPWIRHAILAGLNYIIPNRDCVIIGGTKQAHDYCMEARDSDMKDIIDGCALLNPSIRKAEIIDRSADLRPFRDSIRLERDPNYDRIIHNYGHGGSGVTLCWGSALEVVRLAKEMFSHSITKSKL